MSDNKEELKKQIEALKVEIEELKKQLKENKESDEQKHKEIKDLQVRQHADEMRWKKIGVFTTPLSTLATIITLWLSFKNKKNGNNETKDKFSKSDLLGIAEIIRESKK